MHHELVCSTVETARDRARSPRSRKKLRDGGRARSARSATFECAYLNWPKVLRSTMALSSCQASLATRCSSTRHHVRYLSHHRIAYQLVATSKAHHLTAYYHEHIAAVQLSHLVPLYCPLGTTHTTRLSIARLEPHALSSNANPNPGRDPNPNHPSLRRQVRAPRSLI